MRKKYKNIDFSILTCTILLIIIGLISLYSTTLNSNFEELKKQVIWILVSIPIMIVVIKVDYSLIAKFSPFFYGVTIILLVIVLFTSAINGASSWFQIGGFSFQPGEFGKIAFILFLSYILEKIQSNSSKNINKIKNLALILVIAAIPIGLIIMQPDYGTAVAYLSATILMLFVAGIDKKYILIAALLIAIILPLMYFFVLPEHAKNRINVYLNPNIDPRGAGYNIIQSKLAIGAR